jgi:hypothetical protein
MSIYTEVREWYQEDPSRWVKHRFRDNTGGCCLSTAVADRLPVPGNDLIHPQFNALRAAIEAYTGQPMAIIFFNDTEHTRFVDIINVLRIADGEKLL